MTLQGTTEQKLLTTLISFIQTNFQNPGGISSLANVECVKDQSNHLMSLYFIIHNHTYIFLFIYNHRVKDNELDLFDDNHYANLKPISEVFVRVCTCKEKEVIDEQDETHVIECNYGTYKNCKFVGGKQYYCILNPEGQLRRKRDLRHLESIFSQSKNGRGPDLDVRISFLLRLNYVECH